MKITYDFKEVTKGLKKYTERLEKARYEALRDVTVLIANDVIHGSRHMTGHNRRSITYKIGSIIKRGFAKGNEKPFSVSEDGVPLKKNQAAIYSTSGYGGYLETGTRYMGGIPYFKPALDRNWRKFPSILKEKLRW